MRKSVNFVSRVKRNTNVKTKLYAIVAAFRKVAGLAV